jgi:DNA-binding beta-propeller fold protein YncE
VLRGIICAFVALGCFGSVSEGALAQEVVHALTGTVSSIDSITKTVTVFTDSGNHAEFKDMTDSKAHINLDKKIRIDTASADIFKTAGSYVIVFFFGDNDVRTAVAVRGLGKGPFTSAVGTVVRFDGRGHSISLKDETGAEQTFKLSSDTVAETGMGVMDGTKFQAQKGDAVRIVASTVDGSPTALFIQQK